MNKPLVSIITVVLNDVSHIEQTIKSICNQTYKNIEYIIIDGGSTDGTVDIIKKYKNMISYYVSEKDHGIFDAMNKGAMKSRGDYINFINSGDWHESRYIDEILIRNIADESDYYHSNMKASGVIIRPMIKSNRFLFHMANPVLHPTMIIKKDLFQMVGGFNLNYKLASDHDLILKLENIGAKSTYINDAYTNFELGGASSSSHALSESSNILMKHGQYKYICLIIFIYIKIKLKLIKSIFK